MDKAELLELNRQYIRKLRELSKVVKMCEYFKSKSERLENELIELKKHDKLALKYQEAIQDWHLLREVVSGLWHLIEPSDPHYDPMDINLGSKEEVADFLRTIKISWESRLNQLIENKVWNEMWELNKNEPEN